jgi:hypothetical protein
MTRHDSGLPHENPCAQCGKPIAAPDWTENGPRRRSYPPSCSPIVLSTTWALTYTFPVVSGGGDFLQAPKQAQAPARSGRVDFLQGGWPFVPRGKDLPVF